MIVLVGIALKSLLLAGVTLGLLELMKGRSAAERSWVAHIGLLALVIIAFAPLVLPEWPVETPAIFSQSAPAATHVVNANIVAPGSLPRASLHDVDTPAKAGAMLPAPTLSTTAAITALYAVPAAVLLIITFLALLRLFALRARADVLVDGHWLSALAHAQRRMGFKHGTALLTSNELASPVSWGLMRPVILLNKRAVEATGEAEAIIAHELAHVARMDWIKLLLARFATALFWFNPLVWLLAREAHQLREEAADDTVLAADITDTDYAQLLVGVARHECPGLLLGAHGVAPSKSSLARRVARVLDGKSARGPVARSFAVGVFAGAILVAAPLAAITVTPGVSKLQKSSSPEFASSERAAPEYADTSDVPTDLPHLIAKGVSTSVTTATAAIAPHVVKAQAPTMRVVAPNGATVESSNGIQVATAPNGARVTVYPVDSTGRRRVVAVAASGATAVSYADVDADEEGDADDHVSNAMGHSKHDAMVETAIEMKAMGLTPEYAAAIRSASPALRSATLSEVLELKSVGVTPEYIREMTSAGFANLRSSQIEEARAVGLSAAYAQAIRSTGIPVTFDELVELRVTGIRPDELARMKAAGELTFGKPVRAHGSHLSRTPRPPQPPQPPQRPWDDPDGG
ncbi:MAG TPA: M56 family metallopeptidase [Sphingomicrobium sp.]|nr:M56 family metallopeptidase [Sphingomicrobium sp.]